MTTSGTTDFTLDFTEIAEEAWERAGREMRSGYDLRTARRSMNLMTIEWQNRGINMWTIEQGAITLAPGINTYALPLDTIDLLEHVIRTGGNTASTQADLNITRISVSTYATIPNKLAPGRPIQVWIQRLSGVVSPTGATLNGTINASTTTITLSSTANLPYAGFIKIDNEDILYQWLSGNTLGGVVRGQNGTTAASHTTGATIYNPNLPAITVWLTPDNSQTYQFIYWRLRRVQDAGAGAETADMNFRFLPCVVSGLAYYIAMKVPELADRLPMLKAAYDEQFDLAAGEDREKAAVRFVPRRQFIGRGM
ncbi:MAG: hypothetical protein EBR82_84315 [Caulobacteraceae bacterium]|nr:hypothetical protein [Caulobacteraceae bacterium]